MREAPLRRAQLITTTGVGALTVDKLGRTLVCGGLDYWFRRTSDQGTTARSLDEFRVQEWRLEALLGVDTFRLPPDYRTPNHAGTVPNTKLTIPLLRFPTWHVCTNDTCGFLKRKPKTATEPRVDCPECNTVMQQVRVVIVCARGHLTDFPWHEWVHHSAHPACPPDRLRLKTLPGGGFADLLVSCDHCDSSRSLEGVLGWDEREEGGYVTVLSTRLSPIPNEVFLCRGERAWFGDEVPRQGCDQQVYATLTGASNTYYSDTVSAIYLPEGTAGVVDPALIEALREPVPAQFITMARQLYASGNLSLTPAMVTDSIESTQASLVARYGRAVVEDVVGKLIRGEHLGAQTPETEQDLRYGECQALRQAREEPDLVVQPRDPALYGDVGALFSSINLVPKLRETRVLTGFTRGTTQSVTRPDERRALMWRDFHPERDNWLPASVTYGEGLYLELSPALLDEAWLAQASQHLKRLAERHDDAQERHGAAGGLATPRRVLVHTFAHLLINTLTFHCGYSAASLRERLFVSDEPGHEMAGVLIYTASGDAEGTLGGLVRMGEPGRLEGLIRTAVEEAAWCANDPVCLEAGQGEQQGQGTGGINLAACHACAHLPETSCELFNALLDRTLVVGRPRERELGFFSRLLRW
ncbi:DUF1998 domain-containing protein [Deinococcus sonorensis]|uniref:DUF1998 domain-containing protein n=2 Tax=Deinococcus sonorensis TaxID=309891 RepID=A0AAU7UF86_9DEIO